MPGAARGRRRCRDSWAFIVGSASRASSVVADHPTTPNKHRRCAPALPVGRSADAHAATRAVRLRLAGRRRAGGPARLRLARLYHPDTSCECPSRPRARASRSRSLRAPDAAFPLVLLCFFLSGLAGLVYETAWTREFAFVFGTSNLAVATVLAAYMAGLASGAAVAARLASRVQRPLLVYALLELGIGVAALAVPAAAPRGSCR